jgi:hypothetical protein
MTEKNHSFLNIKTESEGRSNVKTEQQQEYGENYINSEPNILSNHQKSFVPMN